MTDQELLAHLRSQECTFGDAKAAALRIEELIRTQHQLIEALRETRGELSRAHIRMHSVEMAYHEWAARVQGQGNARHH